MDVVEGWKGPENEKGEKGMDFRENGRHGGMQRRGQR